MRGSAGGQCGQQEAKPRVDIRRRKTQMRKDFALNGRIGNADRTGAELVAIVDGVVVKRATRKWIAVQLAHILGTGWRERMVREYRLARLGMRLEQRKIHAPAERVRAFGRRRLAPAPKSAHLVERWRRDAVGA